MALTDLEKAQNKAANRVRDRAYSARYRARREAVEAAENSPEVQEKRRAFDDANEAMNRAMADRDARIRALEARINELRSEIDAIQKAPELAALSDQRRKAAAIWSDAVAAKRKEAESQFPDLEGPASHSATGWVPPKDVKEAMDAARRDAKVGPAKNGKDGTET